jgi:septal ring factor EnvC (AmiA/AmiB activator)
VGRDRTGCALPARYLEDPNMTSAKSALIALIVAIVGIWGCARPPSGTADGADRLRSLEARAVKLEDDFRSAASTRDQLRKKLAAAEEQQRKAHDELEQQIQTLTRERDELRQQLTLRTDERDALTVQFDQFRKNLHELLGQAEATLNKPAEQPVTSAKLTKPGKS